MQKKHANFGRSTPMKATSPGTWRLRWPCRSALSDARDGRVNGAIRSPDELHFVKAKGINGKSCQIG